MQAYRKGTHPSGILLALAILMSLGAVLPGMAADSPPPAKRELPPAATAQVDFHRDIEPILTQRCFSCHGPTTQESGLRLDRRASLLRGGDSGDPAAVQGRSAESPLIKFVARLDPDMVMPPSGRALSDQQVGLLRAWIDQGLKMPEEVAVKDAAADLWSLQPVKKVKPPDLADPWIAGPIDAFILAKLRENHLQPSPPADRLTLVRRLYLDLLGLPPTLAETEQFLQDAAPDAYARLVDRVLASPRYGERWARHWLDVIRFADTDGFEMNTERRNAYPFRDYVIRALNEDRPYDRFLMEHLAGDALGEDAATGFLVGGATDAVKSPDIVLTRTQRQDELADMIGTTGTAMLGLTIGCSRCHDHKFDPIPQRDYYAMQAVFAGVRHGERPLRVKAVAPPPTTEGGGAKAAPTLRAAVNARQNEEQFPATTARWVRFTIEATNGGAEPCIDELEIYTAGPRAESRNVALASAGAKLTSSGDFAGNPKHKLEHINDGRYGNDWSWISSQPGRGWVQVELAQPATIERIVWGRDREQKFTDRLATRYTVEVADEANRWRKVASSDGRASSPSGNEELVYAGVFEQPGPTNLLRRGDPMQPADALAPDALTALRPLLGSLGQSIDAPEQQRRLALARWIARPDNPLTTRVIVNRLWHYHFGQGIVASPSDFGRMGTPPTHPELLDWLAGELVRNGWRLKAIHRMIVLSSTYRQSNSPNARALAADAGCRWLWRFPPRRLEAEAIRDSVLLVSGALDLTMYGPGFSAFEPNSNYVRVYTPKTAWQPADFRRMVYMNKVRREPDGVFGAFDSPDAGQVCPKRGQSTTAIQALNLLNSTFILQQAELLAGRVEREAGRQPTDQVRHVFRLALGRAPSEREAAASAKLLEQHGLAALCRAMFNANEFLFLP